MAASWAYFANSGEAAARCAIVAPEESLFIAARKAVCSIFSISTSLGSAVLTVIA